MITAFRNYLQAVGYGRGSVSGMPRCVAAFFGYCNLTDPKEATAEHVIGFYGWLQTKPNERRGGGLSQSHIHHHLYALRVFFDWLETTGQIPENPTSALTFKRGEKKSREPLTPPEISALFEAATTDRERALLHLLYSCGLRRSEAVGLSVADVHYKARMLYVRRGKGSKRRAVPLTEKVAEALECYALCERKSEPPQPSFLLNKKGGPMRGNTCCEVVRSLKEKAGLEREVTPHHLRHSIATHLLEAGVPIEQVKDFLGHSHLEATQLYAKVTTRQLKNL